MFRFWKVNIKLHYNAIVVHINKLKMCIKCSIRHRNKTKAYQDINPNMHIVHGIGPGSTPLVERIPVPAHRMISPIEHQCQASKWHLMVSLWCIYLFLEFLRQTRDSNQLSLFYQQENSFEGLYSILYRIKKKMLYSPLEEFSAQKTWFLLILSLLKHVGSTTSSRWNPPRRRAKTEREKTSRRHERRIALGFSFPLGRHWHRKSVVQNGRDTFNLALMCLPVSFLMFHYSAYLSSVRVCLCLCLCRLCLPLSLSCLIWNTSMCFGLSCLVLCAFVVLSCLVYDLVFDLVIVVIFVFVFVFLRHLPLTLDPWPWPLPLTLTHDPWPLPLPLTRDPYPWPVNLDLDPWPLTLDPW
jgi:hypothetical protein